MIATRVNLYIVPHWEPAIVAGFSHVPVDSMDMIEDKFQNAINVILNGGPDPIDIERIQTIIDQIYLKRRRDIENGPQKIVQDVAVDDLLFSTNETEINAFLKLGGVETVQILKQKTLDDWLQLLRETLCFCKESPRVKLLAYPSANYSKELIANESRRIEEQREYLGEDGLRTAGMLAKQALESSTSPPNAILLKMPLADVNSITYHNLESYNHTTSKQPDGFDLRSIPFRFQLDNIDTEFVRIFIFLDTSDIKVEDQKYLSLLTNVWLECPLKTSNGTQVSFEEVMKQRERDSITFNNCIGETQSQFMRFVVTLEVNKYENVVTHLQSALFDVTFTSEKINNQISRLLNGITSAKQDSETILNALYNNIYFNNQTYLHAASFLRQERFLTKAQNEFATKPEALIQKLEQLKSQIVQAKNTIVYMATNIERLTQTHGDLALGIWKHFFKNENERDAPLEITPLQRYPVTPEWKYRDPIPTFRHVILGFSGTESCYMKQSIELDIKDVESEQLPATRLMVEYLNNIMFDQIRGPGWTYGIAGSVSVTLGRLAVIFDRASNLVKAYKEFRKLVSYYSSGDDIWDPVKIDAAKGSLIYRWVSSEESPNELANNSISAYLIGARDSFYARRFIQLLSKVTVDEVIEASKKYLPRFVDPDLTNTVIVCGPKAVSDVKELLNQYHFNIKEIDDINNSILTKE